MATLSLRIRDDLKRKAQELAKREGVSLNNYINATLAATVAQAETLYRLQKIVRLLSNASVAAIAMTPTTRRVVCIRMTTLPLGFVRDSVAGDIDGVDVSHVVDVR